MSNSRRLSLIVSLIALLGVTAWLIGGAISRNGPVPSESIGALGRAEPPTESLQDAVNARIQQLESQFHRLHEDVEILRRQRRQLAQQLEEPKHFMGTTEAAFESVGSAAGTNEARESSIKADEIRQQERFVKLEADLAIQPVDMTWNAVAVSSITEVMNAPQFSGSTLIRAECRSTMCKAEVDHESPEALDRFVTQFALVLGWASNSRVQAIDHPDGSSRTIVYFSRDGHNLPR